MHYEVAVVAAVPLAVGGSCGDTMGVGGRQGAVIEAAAAVAVAP